MHGHKLSRGVWVQKATQSKVCKNSVIIIKVWKSIHSLYLAAIGSNSVGMRTCLQTCEGGQSLGKLWSLVALFSLLWTLETGRYVCFWIKQPLIARWVSAHYGKFKPATVKIVNVSCCQQMNSYSRETIFLKMNSNNTLWTFLKMWDQMKCTSFCCHCYQCCCWWTYSYSLHSNLDLISTNQMFVDEH